MSVEAFRKGFGSDNHSGVHPRLLDAIAKANQGHAPSYGTDEWTEKAIKNFQRHFGAETEVFLVFNGTAANVLSLRAMCESYHSVICSDISHINVDECGAPEVLAGCKLIPVKSENGKISLSEIKKHFVRRGDQHFSQSRVVSLTQPTELGTCYSQKEIKEICEWAHANQMLVHIDGARLANAAVSLNLSFSEMTTLLGVDVVSFGGTKNGFLFGEAILFLNSKLSQNFQFTRKQFCQLPSKSRFVAAQFNEYLGTDLWKKIAEHSNSMAQALYEELKVIPEFKLNSPPQANGLFPFIPKAWIKALKEESFFYVWDELPVQNSLQCRLMTTWDTDLAQIKSFSQKILELKNEIPANSLS